MASKVVSAGLLMYRFTGEPKERMIELLLVHPGGPLYASFERKGQAMWGIPKGLIEEGEDAFLAAQREFVEETSFTLPADAKYLPLGESVYKSGKRVLAWAFEGDCDPSLLKSNLCEIEWPLHSGKKIMIPEVDRAQFFTIAEAREKMGDGQRGLLDALEKLFPAECARSAKAVPAGTLFS